MAPQFAVFMYQVYPIESGTDALVCFPLDLHESIFPFRDKLTEALLKIDDIKVNREQDYPLPPDSRFQFYSEKNAPFVEEFIQKRQPSFFSRLMNTAEWTSFQNEEKSVNHMIDVEIETSHDFPCIVVYSRIHSEATLSALIEETARDLGLEISRNTQLGSISDIVTSNQMFNL